MRAFVPVVALVAASFASPAFAASSSLRQPHLNTCNKKADAAGITGRARSEAVQDCIEPSKKSKPMKSTKKHTTG
jgi:hypothetical protein